MFIVGPESQDIPVHYSVIEGDGSRVLRDGSRVDYDAVKTDKGWKATRVARSDSVEVNRGPPPSCQAPIAAVTRPFVALEVSPCQTIGC